MTTGRRPTLPPDELAETLDDSPRRVTGRVPRVDLEYAIGSGDMPPIHVTPTDIADSEWGRRMEADLAVAKAAAAKIARAEKVVYGGAGLIGVGVVAVLKLAFSSGAQSAEARQREVDRVELRASVVDLRVLVNANTAAIAGLRGALDQISRLGAVRVQGPAVQPLLPGDAP